MILMDPHCLNIGFYGTQPVYLDIGSIADARDHNSKAYYKRVWINIIKLYKSPRVSDELFRLMILEHDGINEKSMNNLIHMLPIRCILNFVYYYDIYSFYIRTSRTPSAGKKRELVQTLRKVLPLKGGTNIRKQKNYFKKTQRKLEKDRYKSKLSKWSMYQKELDEKRVEYYVDLISCLAEEYKAEDLVDIAGNQGVVDKKVLEESTIKFATVVDFDEGALEQGYLRARENAEVSNKIQFVYRNLLLFFKSNNDIDNLSSDICLAMAIAHHLVLGRGLKISSFFDIIAEYTSNIAIVEFMPLGLYTGNPPDYYPPIPDFWTLDNFRKEMEKRFRIIKEEQIEINRICLVGIKR